MENYARQIYGQLEAVKSLEKSRPGATEFLYKNCGIRNFGRYDLRTLEHQYDVLTGRAPKSAKPVLTVFYPYSDYNGAFSKNLQAHLGPLAESFEIVIAEGKNAREMKQRLSEINSRYGQISVMFLGGHGTPKSIQLGGGSRLTAESFNDRELRGFFVEKPTMVLISCSTGKSRDWELFYKKPGSNYLSLPKINKDWLEKGIGRQISSDGWLVYAPEVPTNTESIFFSGKGTDGRYRFKVDWYAKGMEYVNGKLAGKTTGGARGKTSRVENTGPGFDISNKEPLYGQLGLELRRAGREYEIIESKYGAAIGKISEQRLGAFFEAATRYKLNFPDREIKANYFPSLNFALQEAYEKWSAKNQGKDLADYLMHLNKVKLPFELEAHEQEIRARLRENGFGEMKKGFIPVRHLGQNVVYSVETQKGAVFIKMQDMVEDAKIAIPLLEKLGRKLYKVHAYENFSIIEKFGNRISVRELQNSGQYGQMRADFLEPGGRYRQKFLESISSWVADMAVLGLWDVNPGNFLVSERGIVERIDFEEFGQRGFSSFKQLSDMLGISFDPVADAGAIPFMKKAFLERWEYLRQHFPEVSGELEGSIGRFMPRLTANQESETGRFYREREKNYGAETPRKIVKNMQNVLSDETGEQAWDRIFGMGKVR
jgi:hypothetical protein